MDYSEVVSFLENGEVKYVIQPDLWYDQEHHFSKRLTDDYLIDVIYKKGKVVVTVSRQNMENESIGIPYKVAHVIYSKFHSNHQEAPMFYGIENQKSDEIDKVVWTNEWKSLRKDFQDFIGKEWMYQYAFANEDDLRYDTNNSDKIIRRLHKNFIDNYKLFCGTKDIYVSSMELRSIEQISCFLSLIG